MKTSAEPVQGFRPSGATLSARSMSWCGPESPPPPCPCLAKYLRAWNAVNDFPARIFGIARGGASVSKTRRSIALGTRSDVYVGVYFLASPSPTKVYFPC